MEGFSGLGLSSRKIEVILRAMHSGPYYAVLLHYVLQHNFPPLNYYVSMFSTYVGWLLVNAHQLKFSTCEIYTFQSVVAIKSSCKRSRLQLSSMSKNEDFMQIFVFFVGVFVEWLHEEFLGLKMLPFQSFTCSSTCADALVKQLKPKQEHIMEDANPHNNYQLRLNSSAKSTNKTSSCSIQ